MNELLELNGWVQIETSESEWKYTYSNRDKHIMITKSGFKTYEDCISDLLKTHTEVK